MIKNDYIKRRDLEVEKTRAKAFIGKKIRFTVPMNNKRFKKGKVLEGIIEQIHVDMRRQNGVYYRLWIDGSRTHIRTNDPSIEIIKNSLDERLYNTPRPVLNKMAVLAGVKNYENYRKTQLISLILDKIN